MKKRNLFSEIVEGIEAIKQHREGKITLRTHRIEAQPPLEVKPEFFIRARQSLHMSRRVFARCTCIPERTLERWEQGRSKPNPEAVALVALVQAYPDTVNRLKQAVQKVRRSKAATAGA
jgi:putative transcriptional regulator